jgi:Flp pilus assembly protein protease CpaA
MKKRKSILQRSAGVSGKLCFLLAVLCAVGLYIKSDELGMQHPITGSLLASSFFFVFIGFVLTVIGNADIPSFKVVSASAGKEKK